MNLTSIEKTFPSKSKNFLLDFFGTLVADKIQGITELAASSLDIVSSLFRIIQSGKEPVDSFTRLRERISEPTKASHNRTVSFGPDEVYEIGSPPRSPTGTPAKAILKTTLRTY